jgi:hypothetical protein
MPVLDGCANVKYGRLVTVVFVNASTGIGTIVCVNTSTGTDTIIPAGVQMGGGLQALVECANRIK